MFESCVFHKKLVTLQPICKRCKMKTIKWLGICLLALLVSGGLSSCGDDEYSSRLRELILKKEMTFMANEMKGDLSYTTTFRNEDLSNYSAQSDASWCHVTIDVEKSQMTVTVDENQNPDERTATVTITDIKAPEVSRSFTVTQKQNDVIKPSSSTVFEVGTDGGYIEIEFQHNVGDCTVRCKENWVQCAIKSGTRGLSSAIISVSVDENDSGAARTAFLTLESESAGDAITYTINQEYVQKTYFNLPKTEYTIDENGGTINVNAQTNYTQFDIFPPEDSWATLGELNFMTEMSVVTQVVYVEPFTRRAPSRSTQFYWQDETITITQYRNLYFSETEVSLMQQESKKLEVYNPDGISVKWASSDEKIATVDAQGNVKGIAPGEVTITVTSTDGKHKDTIKVTVEKPQDLRNSFSVEWQPYYDVVNGKKMVSSLSCTLNNGSKYTIELTKCEIYCDLKFWSVMEYKNNSGVLAPGDSKKVNFDNLAGRASKFGFTLVWYYTFNGEPFEYRCEYTDL